jgi:uncharacterized delta-60 repeat protein
MVGGSFSTYGGSSSIGAMRVDATGAYSSSFLVGDGFTNAFAMQMHAVMVQPDDKVLLAGQYNAYNGVPVNGLIRLNSGGSIDLDFNPGTGPAGNSAHIYAALLQPDGKIMVGGYFITYNGSPKASIVRLTPQGNVDDTFLVGAGVDGWVLALGYQADGKVIIAGQLTAYNGVPRARIARLNTDGSLDTTFDPGTGGTAGRIDDLVIQPDGKIIIVGTFGYFNGVPHNRISRLNTDGSVDMGFNPGAGAVGSISSGIKSVSLQADGKIIIGGGFNTFDGVPRKGLARLNADGSLDTSFDVGVGIDMDRVATTLVLEDGDILIGGGFTSYAGVPRNFIALVQGGGGGTAIISSLAAPQQALRAYPNPFLSDVTFEAALKGVVGISVFDLSGRMVHSASGVMLNGLVQEDLGHLNAGTYVVRVTGENGSMEARVIKH